MTIRLQFAGRALVLLCVASLAFSGPLRADSPATADDAWVGIEKDIDQLHGLVYMEDRAPVERHLLTTSETFMSQYPDDPRLMEVKIAWLLAADDMTWNLSGEAPPLGAIAKTLDSVSPDVIDQLKKVQQGQIRFVQISQQIRNAWGHSADTVAWDSIIDAVSAFERHFGTDFQPQNATSGPQKLKRRILETVSENEDLRHDDILKKYMGDSDGEVASYARSLHEKAVLMMDLKKGPIDLKFKAVDGTQVDLSQLRGKVVLLDFWATWCHPCVEEVPTVVAAYRKYHDQGFEVVGISLDENIDTMKAFTATHQMPWPQFCDANAWQNALAVKYVVRQIPTMWLIDKSGMLVSTNGRDGLDDQVSRLLQGQALSPSSSASAPGSSASPTDPATTTTNAAPVVTPPVVAAEVTPTPPGVFEFHGVGDGMDDKRGYFTNSSFEKGLAGWNPYVPPEATAKNCTIMISTDAPHLGSKCALLHSDDYARYCLGSNAGIAVKAGEHYHVWAWIKAGPDAAIEPGKAGVQIRVSTRFQGKRSPGDHFLIALDGTLRRDTGAPPPAKPLPTTWTKIEAVIEIPPDVDWLAPSVFAWYMKGSLYVDDVGMELAEPAMPVTPLIAVPVAAAAPAP